MKLNLLPTNVSKGAATKTAVVISIVLFLGSIGAATGMWVVSAGTLAHNKAAVDDMRPKAQAVVDEAAQADTVMSQATQVIKNTSLASAMIEHNSVYPRFYDGFLRYIPPFFRITSITASPISADQATVTMQGVLKTYQQYADLMLALMRYPRAVSISRSGYQVSEVIVPPLTQSDQLGTEYKPGYGPIPSDPMARLNYYMSLGRSQGYNGAGGFGGGPGTRSAAVGYSVIQVTMVTTDKLQTPNPRATISSSTSTAAASTSSMSSGFPGAGRGFGGPSGPSGPSGSMRPPMGGAGGGKGGGQETD